MLLSMTQVSHMISHSVKSLCLLSSLSRLLLFQCCSSLLRHPAGELLAQQITADALSAAATSWYNSEASDRLGKGWAKEIKCRDPLLQGLAHQSGSMPFTPSLEGLEAAGVVGALFLKTFRDACISCRANTSQTLDQIEVLSTNLSVCSAQQQ